MKRLYVYKILLAVLLAVCVAGVVFYHRFSTRSSADELYAGEKSRHTDVMATSTDGIAAMAGYGIALGAVPAVWFAFRWRYAVCYIGRYCGCGLLSEFPVFQAGIYAGCLPRHCRPSAFGDWAGDVGRPAGGVSIRFLSGAIHPQWYFTVCAGCWDSRYAAVFVRRWMVCCPHDTKMA